MTRNRLQNGLSTLANAYSMVGMMQEELISLGPEIVIKTKVFNFNLPSLCYFWITLVDPHLWRRSPMCISVCKRTLNVSKAFLKALNHHNSGNEINQYNKPTI